MTDKKSFNPETDIEFVIVKKLTEKAVESIDNNTNNLNQNLKQNNNQIPQESFINSSKSNSNFVNPNQQGFTQPTSSTSTTSTNQKINVTPDFRKAIFFDFGIQDFQVWVLREKFNFPYLIVKDLTQLTSSLRSSGKSILFLQYSSNPKAIEQLVPQIESKFSSTLICLCVQNLDQRVFQQLKIFFPKVSLFIEFPLQLDKVSQALSIP